MSAHVLLNLLNELGKKIRCEALPSILSIFIKRVGEKDTMRGCAEYLIGFPRRV